MKKIVSILLTCVMVFSIILNTGVGVEAENLPGAPFMRCVPDVAAFDTKAGSQTVEYTIYLEPPVDQRITDAQFTVSAPEGMTLLRTEDDYQVNEKELLYIKKYQEDGLFSDLTYTASTGVFLAGPGLKPPSQFMEKEYWVLKIKATIDDMSKAGSYALQISNYASSSDLMGEDSYDSNNYVITSTPVEVSVPLVSVTGIEISPEEKTLAKPGDTFTVAASVKPDNATEKGVTYRSSNAEVATVDADGLVTAVAQGSTGIIATSIEDGEIQATCEVTVNQPLNSIAMNKETLTIKKGAEESLLVSYNPTNTTDDKTITWLTSNASIVTVEEGKITGVEEGSATVTATVGTHTATCEVTVEKTEITEAMIQDIESVEYTGSAVEPKVLVEDGTKTMLEGTDYTVSYKNNIQKGTAIATVTGIGNYKGSVDKSFEIVANKLTSGMVANIEDITYTGSAIIPEVVVKDGEKLLVKDVDYTLECEDNITAGEASVRIIGKNNYADTVTKTFKIIPKSVKSVTINAISDFTYENKAHEPLPVVQDDTTTLVKDVDYRVLYENNTNAGTAKVVITGLGNYSETKSAEFTIRKAEAPVIVFPTANTITYGNLLSTATFNGTSEYGKFEWESEKTVPDVGTGNYMVKFIANDDTLKNYQSIAITEQEVELIVSKVEAAINLTSSVSGKIGQQKVELSVEMKAVGEGDKPTGTVVLKNEETVLATLALENGVASYEWSISEADVYNVSAEYSGDKNYKESDKAVQVDTTKKEQIVKIQDVGDKTYGDSTFELVLEGVKGNGKVTYSSSNDEVITIEGNKATIVAAGSVVVTATIEEDDTYQGAKAELDIIVDKCKVIFKADSQKVRRGQPVDQYTYKVEGLVGEDKVTKEPTLTPSTKDTRTAGTYDISITDVEISNAENYSVEYQNAKLVVEKGYNVIFNTDGGDKIKTVEDILYGDKVIVPEQPTKLSNTFDGWYTSSEYKDEFDFEAPIMEDKEIFAKWALNPITKPDELQSTGTAIEVLNPIISEEDTMKIFTEEELRSLQSLSVDLQIDNIEMAELSEDIQSSLNKGLNEYRLKLGSVYDISLLKTIGDNEPIEVVQLDKSILITITIPKELQKEGRTFYLLREHEGSVEVLEDVNDIPELLSCNTDRFSTYAIAYTDQKVDIDKNIATGDNSHVVLYIALLVFAVISILYVLKKRNRIK